VRVCVRVCVCACKFTYEITCSLTLHDTGAAGRTVVWQNFVVNLAPDCDFLRPSFVCFYYSLLFSFYHNWEPRQLYASDTWAIGTKAQTDFSFQLSSNFLFLDWNLSASD